MGVMGCFVRLQGRSLGRRAVKIVAALLVDERGRAALVRRGDPFPIFLGECLVVACLLIKALRGHQPPAITYGLWAVGGVCALVSYPP